MDLEALMDEGLLIVFNLSWGKIGELTMQALGRFIIARIQAYAMGRENVPTDQGARPDSITARRGKAECERLA